MKDAALFVRVERPREEKKTQMISKIIPPHMVEAIKRVNEMRLEKPAIITSRKGVFTKCCRI